MHHIIDSKKEKDLHTNIGLNNFWEMELLEGFLKDNIKESFMP